MGLPVELMRIIRFGVVGVGATATHMGTAVLCVELAGLSPELATTIGMGASMGVSYFGHQMFTFGVKADHRTYVPRFLVSTVIAYLLNVGLVALITEVLDLPYQVAFAVVAVVIPLSNYLIGRLWVFERGLAASPELRGS